MRREESRVGIKRAIPFYSPAECAILCEYELGSGGEGRKDRDRERGGRGRYVGQGNVVFCLVTVD